jgi:predicted small secreted protein
MGLSLEGERDMKTKIKRVGLMVALLIIAAVVIGCNTIEGAGKDVERSGKELIFRQPRGAGKSKAQGQQDGKISGF